METISTLWVWFAAAPIDAWIAAATALVVAANGITVLTPTKVDDKFVNMLLKVLNFLSGNFGKNRNADDSPPAA